MRGEKIGGQNSGDERRWEKGGDTRKNTMNT